MKKEQIESLADFAELKPRKRYLVEKWLDENPLNPIAVGLTENDIRNFTKEQFPHWSEHAFVKRILDWQKSKKFAQPEVKEVIVGLTDEQARDLLRFYDNSQNESSKRIETYKEWAKTQTFAVVQPQVTAKNTEESGVSTYLVEERSPLKFTPNWDDAPKSATEFTLTGNWYNKNGSRLSGYHISRELRQKPPVSSVEVGQVWKFGDIEFEVTSATSTDVACVYRSSHIDGDFKINGKITDFLAKFERVGGSE